MVVGEAAASRSSILLAREACGQNVSEMPIRVKVEGAGLNQPHP